jgi:hypothetical protein
MSENAQKQLFGGPKVKIMDFEEGNGIFCEFQPHGRKIKILALLRHVHIFLK